MEIHRTIQTVSALTSAHLNVSLAFVIITRFPRLHYVMNAHWNQTLGFGSEMSIDVARIEIPHKRNMHVHIDVHNYIYVG